jgi:5-formyltetrahydrofolate cyclo-ligase
MTEKQKIRKIIKERLKALGGDARNEYSDKIKERFTALPEYQNAVKIFIYISFDNEVHTQDIITDALSKDKRVFVPNIRGDVMDMLEIFNDTVYTVNEMGIVEPIFEEASLYYGDIDLAVIPLLGYDNNLNRLGRGRGFYDKFLSGKKCIKAGIAFTAQRADKLPREPHDIPLDMVITEEGIVR